MTNRNALALWVSVAILLCSAGLVFDGLALAVGVGGALALPSLWLCFRLDRRGALGLVPIFLVALSLRWLVSSSINYLIYPSHPVLFAPDEFIYDYSGWRYTLYLMGKAPHPWGGGTVTGIIQLVGYSYYLFGHVIMVPKLIVAVIGAWTAVLTALIARRGFSDAVSRRAGWLAAVFPSLVLWSSVLMKDTDSLLGAQLALLGFLHLRQRLNAAGAALLASGLGLISLERPYEIMFVALAIAASFLVRGDGERRLMRNAALFVVLSAVMFFVIKRTGADTSALGSALGENETVVSRLAAVRAGYSQETVGSAIRTDLVDPTTAGGLVLWLPIGLIYFFLAPFPFTGQSVISFATAPEMLLLYYLVPSLWRSLRAELRRRDRGFMPIFFYLLISSVGWSIAITNVGTIYRYRAQVLFVLLILIAADQVRRRQALALGKA